MTSDLARICISLFATIEFADMATYMLKFPIVSFAPKKLYKAKWLQDPSKTRVYSNITLHLK